MASGVPAWCGTGPGAVGSKTAGGDETECVFLLGETVGPAYEGRLRKIRNTPAGHLFARSRLSMRRWNSSFSGALSLSYRSSVVLQTVVR